MRRHMKKAIKKVPFGQRRVLWIAVVALLILFGLSKPLFQAFQTSEPPPRLPVPVQTVSVKQAPMPSVIETVGALSAKVELTIKTSAAGRVDKLLVEAGSWVKKDTVLTNIIGAPEVKAPFDGYLTDWHVKAGEYIGIGTELIELVNTDLLSLTYQVPEHYASQLDLGQRVEVSVKASPDEIFEGVVKFISPVVDEKTHTILIRADVQNPEQNLWPGMSSHIRHVLVMNPQALVIPEASLLLTMEGYEVFVVKQGQIERRKITIGERQGGRVHVLTGLSLGEPVVLTRTALIEEGAPAVAQDWNGDW